jgi:hypothetical protein
MFPIASIGPTPSGNTAVIEFQNIPQTFTHLQLRLFGRSTTTATNTANFLSLNADSTNTHYDFHYLKGDGSSATSGGATSDYQLGVTPAASSTANVFGATIVDFLDYTNTNKYKTWRALSGYDANGSGVVGLWSGLWQSTAAITQIDLYSNNLGQYSWGVLYGIQTSNATGA